MKVVTRFAPSPTGYIHIGNIRAAIYPYLVAKQAGGTFILRIEDTDQNRFVEGATDLIEDTLKWLGLDWDEGPIVGGNHGPYFQTERKSIYHEWAKKLIESGRAYADPTPSEKINEYRESDSKNKISYLYRNHRPDTNLEWHEGIPLRFKSEPKTYTYHDEVYGDLTLGPETQDDIILIKADGLPTYNFAHIVDDATMGVTHLMRGQEYLPSVGNYLALYEALGVERPIFTHMPHILGPTGNKKLSKRDGAKSVVDYRKIGILPEAILNYLTMLGWNEGNGVEDEIYSKADLIKKFSLDHIQKSGARFDENKLIWLNGMWIRKIFDEQGAEALYKYTEGFWPESAESASKEYKLQILSIVYDRLKVLSDLGTMTDYFFKDPEIDLDLITNNKFLKKFSESELEETLKLVISRLSELKKWQANDLQEILNQLLQETNKKPAELFSLVRIALSFAPFSPALNLTMEVLGRETTLARLNAVARAI